MSTTEWTPDAATGPSIAITFDVTSKEAFRMGRELARASRSPWPLRLVAVFTTAMAVKLEVSGDWLPAGLLTWVAFESWTGFLAMDWLVFLLLGRWSAHFDLEVDERGIRGEHQYEMTRGGRTEHKRIDHNWRRLRKVERIASCIRFEFHGGSEEFIPLSAFGSSADQEQCEAWARAGLEGPRS